MWLTFLDTKCLRGNDGKPLLLNVSREFRRAPSARQRNPNVVAAGVCGKRMSRENARGKLLPRRCFVSYRADYRVGTSVMQPSSGKRDHKKNRHLYRRTQSCCQEACRIMVGSQEK